MPSFMIIHRTSGSYDVFSGASGEWLFSRNHADNIFEWLSEMGFVHIKFIDEYL